MQLTATTFELTLTLVVSLAAFNDENSTLVCVTKFMCSHSDYCTQTLDGDDGYFVVC